MRLLLPVLAAACWAGEAEAVRLQLAATSNLESHWNASVLGRVLVDPSAAALRSRWTTLLAEVQGVQSARSLQMELVGVDGKGQSRWAMQADLGTQAPQVTRRIVATYRFPRQVAVPAADEAWQLDGAILARFGGIVAFGRPADLLPLAPPRATSDIAVEIGIPALAEVLHHGLDPDVGEAGILLDLVVHGWRSLSVRAELTPEGAPWHGVLQGATSGLRPVDRGLLARLPANTTAVVLLGLDGPGIWRSAGGRIAAEAMLAGLVPLRSAVEACDGTIALLQTPGVPYPGISLVMPRQAASDRLIAGLCTQLGAQVPEDGGSAFLTVPDLPVPLLVSRGRTHWLVTSDALLAAGWSQDGAGGFLTTAMGEALQRRAPAASCMLLACDGGTALRSLIGLINQELLPNRDLNQAEKQALLTALSRLSTMLTPAYQWGVAAADRVELTGEGGDLTWVVLPALAALWALPEWIGNGTATAEKAAMSTLKSILFPAEMQFQAAMHMDQDGDGIGEYGLISELSGRRPAGKAAVGKIQLVQGPLVQAEVSVGYRFTAFLPDGRGGAVGESEGLLARPSMVGPGKAADADEQEARFVIYAWPAEADAGQRIFAIDQTGQVRESLWDGQPPVWNSLYDGGSWADDPVWPAVKRGARRR